MKDLFLLITIVRRYDANEYEEFYSSEGVGVVYTTPCNGTAHAKTLNLLGIERTEKSMLLSTVTSQTLKRLKRHLTMNMKIDLPDRGVTMAIPLSGVGGNRTLEFFNAGQKTSENIQTEDNSMESTHELIVAIYERGYTDMVMDAAREAGAAGGTTINAKGTAAGAEKFFGLTLAVEKEIVFIVSDVNKKKDIMKAIMQKAGVDSKAHALVFSLPVSDTAGFRFSDTIEKDA
ncbi:MAG: P-II family nitrogen regulator [Clostridia bacterium]|nr:P-II family nitrogen regulator [Clostridia bacterium]